MVACWSGSGVRRSRTISTIGWPANIVLVGQPFKCRSAGRTSERSSPASHNGRGFWGVIWGGLPEGGRGAANERSEVRSVSPTRARRCRCARNEAQGTAGVAGEPKRP